MSYFVAEGLDFAGKSSLAKHIAQVTKARFVAEPYNETPAARERKAKLVSNTMTMDQEIAGYAEARVEAFKAVIHPMLTHSRDVISDRNFITSMVYQSDEHVGMKEIFRINQKLLSTYGYDILPTAVFFIDIPHEVFLERLALAEAGGRELNAKDLMFKDKAVFEKYREKYLEVFKFLTAEHNVPVYKFDHTSDYSEVIELISEIKNNQ